MLYVSEAWKTAVLSDTRKWVVNITIKTAFDTFELNENDVESGTLTFSEGVTDESQFGVGCAFKDDFSVTLINTDGRFDEAQLNGAIMHPFIGLMISPDEYEYVPLGVFIIDTVDGKNAKIGQASKIHIKAFNLMGRFEQPFSGVSVVFPITARNLLTSVCQHCKVPLGTFDFMNKDYLISVAPEDGMSCRDVVSCIAEIAGCWARIDRHGMLELDWFDNPAPVFETQLDGNIDTFDGGVFTGPPAKAQDGGLFRQEEPVVKFTSRNRYDFVVDDAPVEITGIILESDKEKLLAGSDRYALVISANPLIQENAGDIVWSLWKKLQSFSFLPYSSSWKGDPALQAGDMIMQTDRKGNTYRTLVTHSVFNYQKKCRISGKGKSETAVGYVDPMKKEFSRLRGKLQEKQEQINAIDLAARSLFALFTGVTGGYRIDGDELGGEHKGRMYLALDSPDIEKAQKVWSYSVAGIFYFENGIHNEPSSAWGNDGSALFNLVTADRVQTGMLKSLASIDGEPVSWLNMDTGQFNFGAGAIQYDPESDKTTISGEIIVPAADSTSTVPLIIKPYINGAWDGGYQGVELNFYGIETSNQIARIWAEEEWDREGITHTYNSKFCIYTGEELNLEGAKGIRLNLASGDLYVWAPGTYGYPVDYQGYTGTINGAKYIKGICVGKG